MIWKLVAMLALGILSGLLSFYNKNFYVRVFNDILGKEEDENVAVRVGRGFFYGFFFPIYFSLLLTGLIALVVFLIIAGIIAAVIFVIVWATEKLLPNEWVGELLIGLFEKVGIKRPTPVVPVTPAIPVAPAISQPEQPKTPSEPESK
ncbi:hypothetical protein [Desulfomonile tiedjei]|uniref:Uncharacterized protein n=1 Tax=Desulfomonile tiedjei (strain ATCC 49306 / DSM 6799 / DCB-1) TaxID=706587 RepID=I4C7R3_DESTA|nr:hypothetical protein [Desulfomonile tiedjei]AFM25604.1 hypothetical protein Desti_2935 [Desulfomonile tiedjei DSM 6799]